MDNRKISDLTVSEFIDIIRGLSKLSKSNISYVEV